MHLDGFPCKLIRKPQKPDKYRNLRFCRITGYFLYFGLITHNRNVVYGDKCQRIFLVDKVHKFLIFCLINDRDDLVSFLHILCPGGFIDSGSAVQIMDDKIPEFFFFLGDNAHTSFNIMVKDKMIQDNAVEISAEDTENDGLFVIDERGGKCDAHS